MKKLLEEALGSRRFRSLALEQVKCAIVDFIWDIEEGREAKEARLNLFGEVTCHLRFTEVMGQIGVYFVLESAPSGVEAWSHSHTDLEAPACSVAKREIPFPLVLSLF